MTGVVRRRAMARGPLGGSRPWTIVWAVLLGIRLARRLTRRRPKVVFSHQLKSGESVLISDDAGEPRISAGR